MGKYLLGIDNGGTMTKAALYDLEGNEVAISSSKTAMYQPEPGFTERNIEEMWQANVNAIKGVIEKAGIDGSEVIGLSATGHGNGLYLVRADGSQTYNGMISTDVRGKEYVIKWQNDGTHETILPKTMQSVFAGQPTTLLRWFMDHRPEVLEETRWIFMCKDYIRFRLTGEAYGEIADMSGSSLMNVRDVKYDADLLKDMGLESIYDKLPPLRYSGEVCGTITKEVAELTGLVEGTPVAGGCMDIHASAMAVGITDEDKMCVVAGTWSINEYISKTPVVDKDLFMTSIYPIPGYWMILEGSPTSASNLEWFLTEILKDVDLKGQNIYDYSNACVEAVGDGDSGIVFLPFLFASNVNINAKACFVGFSSYHTRADLLRAVYEGIVFSHRYHIEKLLKYRNAPKAVRIAGGVVKSRVWVQMFADILQVPIEVTDCTELGALGAAICAGVATNAYESFKDASDAMVKIAFTAQPDPTQFDRYEKKYARYLKVINALDGIWDEY
jgi:L-xylulokinase